MTNKYEAMREALNAMVTEFRGHDLPYGSKAYAAAITALNVPEDKPETFPKPGTSEYGSLVNKASKEADQCFSIHAERFKWLCKFEQAFRALATQPEAQQPGQLIAWERRPLTIGCKRFMTQAQYDAQSDEMKANYQPFKCASCEQPAQALTDELVNLIRQAANVLDDLTPHQTPETSSAREIANDLREAIGAKLKC